MSDTLAFPLLNDSALDAMARLRTPIHIFSFVSERVIWANAAGLQLWNSGTLEELRSRDLGIFSHATRNRLSAYRDAFAKGEDRVETWVLYPKGQATPGLCRMSGVSLVEAEQAMLVEHLGRADAIPAAELRLIEAIRQTPLMISLYGSDGSVLMRNPAASATFRDFDRSAADITDVFGAAFANHATAAQLRAQLAKFGRAATVSVMQLPGAPSHEVVASRATDPASGGDAMLVQQRDVTEMLETRRLLAASEEALDVILDLTVSPIVILSASNKSLVKANAAGQSFLDASASAQMEDLFDDKAQFHAIFADLIAGDASGWVCRLRNREKGGHWCSITGLRLPYAGLDSIILFITDIDAIVGKVAPAQAAMANEEAVALQRKLLAIAAHELRTPLAGIDSAAQRIERQLARRGDHDGDIAAPARRIRTTVARLLRMIQDTLDQVSAQAEAMPFRPELTDLAAFLDKCVRLWQEANPNVEVRLIITPLPRISVDHDLLRRALINLLDNALKYGAEGAPIELRAGACQDHVTLDVRDFGKGLPPAERTAVFSEFQRGSNAGGQPGHGLGLSIVQRIVQLHDGFVEIVDTQGPGTTVRISLPRLMRVGPASE